MKTYTLKSVARRGSMLAAAFVVAGASFLPAMNVSADALNPLTDRSLTLSSGSPGWAFTDGSGNSTYAPPNSGANGQKTGNTFDFKVSTDTSSSNTVKAMTFQYCTTSAGNCQAPGNITNGGTNAANVANKLSDLEIVTSSPGEIGSGAFGTYVNSPSLDGGIKAIPDAAGTGNNFTVYYRTAGVDAELNTSDDVWAPSTGWTMTAVNSEPGASTPTGRMNQINLVNTDGGLAIPAGTQVKVVFFATNSNYITNPGAGAFFVKINTYSNVGMTTVVDGGVTVANVMNESIQITTKVLETMQFSVGTVDPYTLQALADEGDGEDETSQLYAATGSPTHGPCETILKGLTPGSPQNTLQMGDPDGEFSLGTAHTYSTHSYWRLSSNSSAGATVYYSGNTLSNTVEDKIDAIYRTTPDDGLSAAPQEGREQFGLALDNGTGGNYEVSYATERATGKIFQNGADNLANGLLTIGSQGIDPSVTDNDVSNIDANASWHSPRLFPLTPTANYGGGTGVVNADWNSGNATINTAFAFDEDSQRIPVAIASQDSQVVDCVTGKMRYIANIAATTPAGIYTTKINYIAAPQY